MSNQTTKSAWSLHQVTAICQCGAAWHCKSLRPTRELVPLDSLRLKQCPMCRPPSEMAPAEAPDGD